MSTTSYPKLRTVHSQWIEHMGQPALLLQDRLIRGAPGILVPQVVAPLLALCDGTRDAAAIRTAMELWTGIRLDQATLDRLLSQLDEAMMLDNDRSARAFQGALQAYRSAPFRVPLLAGGSYPANPEALAAMLDGWLEKAAANGNDPVADAGDIRGLVCPHIDYERGGQIYGDVWSRARTAVSDADLFVILGTDHAGGPGELTLTRQSFQTPFGVLATDSEAVQTVAEAIGAEAAFRSELNHQGEHSVELAAVWLHHLVRDRSVRMLPVLCGSFQPFVQGEAHPREDGRWQAAVAALRGVVQGRRALVVAAADLAHVGPSFGDPSPLQAAEKADLSVADMAMLATLRRGDAEGFLSYVVGEGDSRRVCGLPPIYLALQILGDVEGDLVSYAQCPAPGGSAVSVAGLSLR
jgi:MEMO1 family protein